MLASSDGLGVHPRMKIIDGLHSLRRLAVVDRGGRPVDGGEQHGGQDDGHRADHEGHVRVVVLDQLPGGAGREPTADEADEPVGRNPPLAELTIELIEQVLSLGSWLCAQG